MTFHVDHEQDTGARRATDDDEALRDFQAGCVDGAGVEEDRDGVGERDTVLAKVRASLRVVPLELTDSGRRHLRRLSRRP